MLLCHWPKPTYAVQWHTKLKQIKLSINLVTYLNLTNSQIYYLSWLKKTWFSKIKKKNKNFNSSKKIVKIIYCKLFRLLENLQDTENSTNFVHTLCTYSMYVFQLFLDILTLLPKNVHAGVKHKETGKHNQQNIYSNWKQILIWKTDWKLPFCYKIRKNKINKKYFIIIFHSSWHKRHKCKESKWHIIRLKPGEIKVHHNFVHDLMYHQSGYQFHLENYTRLVIPQNAEVFGVGVMPLPSQ